MTEAERTELAQLESRMRRALDGDQTVEIPAGAALRRMLDLQAARVRDDALREYETGTAGYGAAQTIARRMREQSQ